MAGDHFEKIQMAVDNLKQSMEDEYWVNMNEDAEDWLTENAEEHGYVNEDLLADALSEQERLTDEIKSLNDKIESLNDISAIAARSGRRAYQHHVELRELTDEKEDEIEEWKEEFNATGVGQARLNVDELMESKDAEIERLKKLARDGAEIAKMMMMTLPNDMDGWRWNGERWSNVDDESDEE